MEKTSPELTVHEGIYYFRGDRVAAQWAEHHGWPTDRIIRYERGFAIQCGKSGNYAGPNESPTPYRMKTMFTPENSVDTVFKP